MNANQATKEKTLPAMNGNAVLAAAQGRDERAEVVRGLPRATQDRIARRLIADASEMNHDAEAVGCIAQIKARSTFGGQMQSAAKRRKVSFTRRSSREW